MVCMTDVRYYFFEWQQKSCSGKPSLVLQSSLDSMIFLFFFATFVTAAAAAKEEKKKLKIVLSLFIFIHRKLFNDV